jgi:maltose 6'-phosphate phosphatase
MMSRIQIPGFRKVNVYNTHLCAFCSPEERLQQAGVLYDFIQKVEFFIPGQNPIILGGDFNTEPDPAPSLYDAIIDIAGFKDSFYVANGGDCRPNPPDPDTSGCTYAVPGNDFVGPLETPVRIDYLFYKNWLFDPGWSQVVFNTEGDWASDHSAVVTDFTIPND